MPAASLSPLPKDMGPAIQMDPSDHRKTSSYGGRAISPNFYTAQRELLARGQFSAAFLLDAIEAEAISSEYTGAIIQASMYLDCLKANGLVKN